MGKRNVYFPEDLDRQISERPRFPLSKVCQDAARKALAQEARTYAVRAGDSEASAWTFVLVARARGWVVDKPNDNGFGYWFVTVYDDKGEGW